MLIRESGAESVSVAVYDVETRRELLFRPDVKYHPASTMKAAVMVEVFRQARTGRFRMEDPIPVKNQFKSIADDSAFSVAREDDADSGLHDRIGAAESVRELTRRMIVRSSNLATNLLIDLVGAECVTKEMARLGARDLIVLRGVEDTPAFEKGLNNSATARSLMTLMRRLAEGKAGSESDSAEMIRILESQEFNEGIPAGLPPGTRAAHKTGWITGIYHDAAIVFLPGRRPYVLVIMTRGIRDVERAHRLAADVSKAAYEWVLRHRTGDRAID